MGGGVAQLVEPGLQDHQLPVERSVTLVSSIAVERRRCALHVCSVARLQKNKKTLRSTQLVVVVRVNQALERRVSVRKVAGSIPVLGIHANFLASTL